LLALYKLWRIVTGSITEAELIGVAEKEGGAHQPSKGESQ